ncbi:unnamed protein product [Closterium sp. Naga37s-1]|nr:unnamed protein product [Closterium sp. Naga37s-1]
MASVPPKWKTQLAQGMPLSATQVCPHPWPQAIIVRSSEEKHRLLALFAAKPDVILFNFFTSPHSTTPWALIYTYMRDAGLASAGLSRCTCATSSRSVNNSCSCGKGQQQLLRFDELKHCALCVELKHLYVAVTRTKQRLWVLDEDRAGGGDGDASSRAWEVGTSAPMRALWHALGVVAVRRGSEVTPESVKREPDEDDLHTLAFTPHAAMSSLPPASHHAPGPLLPPAVLPAVARTLFERSPPELLLEAARTLEEIGRNAEAGHAYVKARNYVEAGQHLRQLVALEDEQGVSSRVAGLLERAGALLEAAQYSWQQGSPGRALVCFVHHLHCRLKAVGRGALRVQMRKRAGEAESSGGGVEVSAEEVEMAERLWAVERWGFAERDAYEASDLAWVRVEMSVLLLVMAHDVHLDTHDSAAGGDGP